MLINGNEIVLEKLHEKIWVFKNAFKSGPEMINFYKENFPAEDWIDWYAFGSHILIPTGSREFSSFPTRDDWEDFVKFNFDKVDDINLKVTNKYVYEMLQVFYDATKLDVEALNINYPNWVWDSLDIANYHDSFGVNEFQGMSYHTDFQEERREDPGLKFGTTCLFYLNDDYEGGGIHFIELSDDKENLISEVEYKPGAGDLVIFPSGHPFYHSSLISKNGKKHLTRTYWRYDDPGSDKWHEDKKNHSEEEWKDILRERHSSKSRSQGESLNKWNMKLWKK